MFLRYTPNTYERDYYVLCYGFQVCSSHLCTSLPFSHPHLPLLPFLFHPHPSGSSLISWRSFVFDGLSSISSLFLSSLSGLEGSGRAVGDVKKLIDATTTHTHTHKHTISFPVPRKQSVACTFVFKCYPHLCVCVCVSKNTHTHIRARTHASKVGPEMGGRREQVSTIQARVLMIYLFLCISVICEFGSICF